MSSFVFIQDEVLRENINHAFDHIQDLLALSESKTYKERSLLVSSLRKTIIIHIASIIEAILLWKLEQVCESEKIELVNDWRYLDINIIYTINDSDEIIAGRRKKDKRKISKLDFSKIADLCYKHKIISTTGLFKRIKKVREIRNRQHLGGLKELEKIYTRRDLEYCFSTLEKTKDIGQK